MSRYILKDLSSVSDNQNEFPLLCCGKAVNDVVDFHNIAWPRRVRFFDGQEEELFSGGIITADEISYIANKIAQELTELYAGQRLLVIQILEGAIPFCKMVCDHLAQLPAKTLDYDIAGIKVSSYLDGTRAERHQCSRPLHRPNGNKITTLTEYDRVIILDDLIDAGSTFAWLVDDYLPSFKPKQISGYFMLEKNRKRSAEVDNALERLGAVCGKRVADEWVVGYGLDIRLSGKNGQPPLHLFRCQLPGGIYAFNSSIEKKLINEYHEHPQNIKKQLQVLVGEE